MDERSEMPSAQFPGTDEKFGLLEILVALAEHAWLILLGTLLIATAAFALTRSSPKTYTSVAYLALQEDTGQKSSPDSLRPLYSAREVEALIRSPAVLSVALAQNKDTTKALGASHEARLRELDRRIRLNVAPGNMRKTSSLFMLEVDDSDPAGAQAINTALINALIETVKPKPLKRSRLEQQLNTASQQLESVSSLINRLGKETPNLVAPSSLGGELATPIASLLQQQADLVRGIAALKLALAGGGIDADTIVVPPSLPSEPNERPRIVLIASMLGVSLLSLLAILKHGITWLSSRPQTAGKWNQIVAGLKPWKARA